MTNVGTHLTESERQLLAEAAPPGAIDDAPSAHLSQCVACADDVARLRTVMSRARELARGAPLPDDLWPSIKSRIEARKIVTIGADVAPIQRVRRVAPSMTALVGLATLTAAAVVLGVLDNRAPGAAAGEATGGPPSVPTTMIADSTRVWAEESKQLLDRLQLQRALLRPDAAQALDADLRTIDAAIAELEDAIARDPANPALRQLLASSYRQKVELLKRAGNAG